MDTHHSDVTGTGQKLRGHAPNKTGEKNRRNHLHCFPEGTCCHSHLCHLPEQETPIASREGLMQTQAMRSSSEMYHPPHFLSLEAPRRPQVCSVPVGTPGRDRCPTSLAPLINEDTPMTRTCNRSAHELLIHYEPRGREIRQKIQHP